MKLGAKFWVVLLAIVVGVVVAGIVFAMLFSWAWYAWGFLGACLVLSLMLVTFGYAYDRREQSRRKRLAA
jgi:bacteriorhodopsin